MNKKQFLVGILASALALTLAGCSGGTKGGSANSSASGATSSMQDASGDLSQEEPLQLSWQSEGEEVTVPAVAGYSPNGHYMLTVPAEWDSEEGETSISFSPVVGSGAMVTLSVWEESQLADVVQQFQADNGITFDTAEEDTVAEGMNASGDFLLFRAVQDGEDVVAATVFIPASHESAEETILPTMRAVMNTFTETPAG